MARGIFYLLVTLAVTSSCRSDHAARFEESQQELRQQIVEHSWRNPEHVDPNAGMDSFMAAGHLRVAGDIERADGNAHGWLAGRESSRRALNDMVKRDDATRLRTYFRITDPSGREWLCDAYHRYADGSIYIWFDLLSDSTNATTRRRRVSIGATPAPDGDSGVARPVHFDLVSQT